MSLQQRVLLAVDAQIATVTLNRADKYNALDMPMLDALLEVAQQIKSQTQIRAVIIEAKGKVFCAGLDIAAMGQPWSIAKLLLKTPWQSTNKVQRVAHIWRSLPQPVIAVVHGKCIGGGLQIAMGADFRYSSTDCEFSILEGKWGLVPDMSGFLAWRKLLRDDYLRELVYSGMFIDAQRAQQLGLVTHVTANPQQQAVEFAHSICQQSPDAIKVAKKLINNLANWSDKQLLRQETRAQFKVLGRYNQRQKAQAVTKNTAPKFK